MNEETRHQEIFTELRRLTEANEELLRLLEMCSFESIDKAYEIYKARKTEIEEQTNHEPASGVRPDA